MRTHDWHPKIIESYLVKYYKNKDSRDTVRVYLKAFFERIKKEPDELVQLPLEEIQNLLFEYAKKIEDKPKKTQKTMLSILKKFLTRNRIDIPELTWEDLQIRNNLKKGGSRPLTKKETPTGNDLKKILSYATGVKSRSLFVLLASTGLRIDEALNLTFDDIDLNEKKVMLTDKAKFEIPRYTFFTTEAKELLELWIPERKRMLQKRYKTSVFVRNQFEKMGYTLTKKKVAESNGIVYNNWIISKDGEELTKEEIIQLEKRIFPFDYVTARRMWENLLEKAGHPYNKKDNNPKLQYPRYMYNVHSIRRFWFTNLMFDRTNEEFINYMGGHTTFLDNIYKFENKVMETKLKTEYDTHASCLLIFESDTSTETTKRLDEKDIQIKELQEKMGKMEFLMNQKEHLLKLLEMQVEQEKIKNKLNSK